MMRRIIKSLVLIFGMIILVSPVMAVDINCDGATGVEGQSDLCAQLKKDNDPKTKITNIVSTILPWAAGIAILLLTYAGFLYTTSSGSVDKIKRAKDIIIYTIIGIVVIMLAGTIVGFVISQIGKIN